MDDEIESDEAVPSLAVLAEIESLHVREFGTIDDDQNSPPAEVELDNAQHRARLALDVSRPVVQFIETSMRPLISQITMLQEKVHIFYMRNLGFILCSYSKMQNY